MRCLHISVSINIFTEMGGRKFRMEHHRKNEERKIARPSMIVSVPRNAVTLSVGLMTIQSSAPVLHLCCYRIVAAPEALKVTGSIVRVD